MNHYQGKREAPRPEPQRRSGASEQKPQASHAGASAAPDGGHPPKKQKEKGRYPLKVSNFQPDHQTGDENQEGP